MAEEHSPLRRLAAQAGIAPGYHDIFGRYHQADDEVLAELLRALELLPREGAPEEEIRYAGEAEHWEWMLPPVRVVWAREGRLAQRLALPELPLPGPLRWRLTEEGGRVHEEALDPERLPVTGRNALAGTRFLARDLPLPLPAPGYHRLEILAGEAGAATVIAGMSLIVAPDACYRPAALDNGGRVWGPAVQLYAVRSERNWGIGDFTDLAMLMEQWAERGANIVGLNPLHALFLGNPAHASPYSPTSRRFLNVLYLDCEAVPEFADCEPARALVRSGEFQLRLKALRDAELVDYPGVAAAKLAVLEPLYRHFRERHLATEDDRGRAFRAFQRESGPGLRQYATFEALYERLRHEHPQAWGWEQWPESYHDPDGEAVQAFVAEQLERIEFYEYLQWQAQRQLAAVGERSEQLGLGVGLYLDLAVSVDRGGADVWRGQGLYAPGVSVGAPPDDFNRQGQNWGLPPFNPRRLREAGYAPFIAMLRDNMRRAGALRIDHVMGLMRLFWIPPGRSAADGAYVHYPFDDLLGIVALESQRNRSLVIGEDLGTVPGEVREGMARVHMLSYRLLYFEKTEGNAFKPVREFPVEALAAVSTHDLPTLAGYWEGHDIAERGEMGLFPDEEARAQQIVGRAQDRAALLLALEREGLLPEGTSVEPGTVPAVSDAFIRAVHSYLARSSAAVMMVQPEDVLGAVEQVNLPGSTEALHPNWRRKLKLNLEGWPQDGRFLRLTAALAETRPGGRRPPRQRAPLDIPRATYRLQLNSGFRFRDAAAQAPYLARLGVSHVYCSPYLKARPGSQHGYDIIDHNALNPELGSAEDYEHFCRALEQHGLRQLLDIVPNHMGVMGQENRWWLDVLENGPASPYAGFFDIDWAPAKRELHGKVLLPVLGGRYGEILESGQLALRFEPQEGSFSVWYYEHRFPVAPESYPELLGRGMDLLGLRMGERQEQLLELQSLITAFGHLPGRHQADAAQRLERQRDLQLHKQRLARLCAAAPEIAAHISEQAAACNGQPGEPASFDELHALLEAQAYRLAHWQVAADEINYRRFFDIHDLAGLRQEDPRVFEATHQLILKLVEDGRVHGLRVDHPDGLFDPQGYFDTLQARIGALDAGEPAIYLLAEKILGLHEALPEAWPVHGTTGYGFLNLLNGLFVEPGAQRRLLRFYRAFSGERLDFDALVYKCKRLIMKYALSSELNVLAFELNRMSEQDRHTRDFTLNRLRAALAEFVAWLPVYRTYERDGEISDTDRRYIDYAIHRAKQGARAEEVAVYDFLRDVLLRQGWLAEAPEQARQAGRFAMRLQQYTGPVMAKGLEDTAFYRYFPLVALNEVGGDPRRCAVTVNEFHAANASRAQRWPHALLASSTHDNKRSEDVRARIDVISELQPEWRRRVRAWAAIAAPLKRAREEGPAPDRNDEYLLYQTLVGFWPLGAEAADDALRERVRDYMLKAVREAKRHTSWINPDPDYEAAVADFTAALMGEPRFLAAFLPFQRRVARLGLFNSLSQTLLKFTAPGVPDLYQGNELWDFSLVDPDNRRPVDYRRRAELLATLEGAVDPQALLASLHDGRAKLLVTDRVLAARREHETLFRDGDYRPLAISGAKAEHLCAFARSLGEQTAVTVAPRLYAALLGGSDGPPLGEPVWADTRIALPAGMAPAGFIEALGGAPLRVVEEAGRRFILVGEALARFPVALLLSAG